MQAEPTMAKAFLPSKDILKAADFLLPHLLAQNLGQSKVEGLCIDENLRRGPRAALQPAGGADLLCISSCSLWSGIG